MSLGGEVIHDLAQLRRHGQVRRRVQDLIVPVEEWRDVVRGFARREGFRVRTGLAELMELSDPSTRQVRQVSVVYAVRIGRPGAGGAPHRWRPSRWERPPRGLH
jgi:hypothetical protein